jgi:hypothetical protein
MASLQPEYGQMAPRAKDVTWVNQGMEEQVGFPETPPCTQLIGVNRHRNNSAIRQLNS